MFCIYLFLSINFVTLFDSKPLISQFFHSISGFRINFVKMSCCFPSKADFKPQKSNLVQYPDRKLVKSSPPQRNSPKLIEFSLAELREATKDFNRLLLIGEGGFGRVYKGRVLLPNGNGEFTLVAIKKLDKDGVQGRKQWLAEVQFLGTVCHPNLVKLLGYCATETDVEREMQLLLVYEYMPNKSLDQHLFYADSKTISWEARLRIMLGAARALAYLHELEIQVIYRDFKSANVLLDKDFRAKLSDFGLAREGPSGDDTHVSTAVVGTCGYAAPEYVGSGRLTSKSDVYSFGVVLYEILTGRRVMDRNRPPAEKKLLLWVKQFPAGSKRFSSIIDPRIRNSCSLNVARKIAKLANNCVTQDPKDRPTMSQVVERLKQAIRNSDD